MSYSMIVSMLSIKVELSPFMREKKPLNYRPAAFLSIISCLITQQL